MTTAPDHGIVPVERVTSRLQRIFCKPYSIELQAGACVYNYNAVSSPDATPDLKQRRGTCLTCADGQQIRERLQAQKSLNEATSLATKKSAAFQQAQVNRQAVLTRSLPEEPIERPNTKATPRCEWPGCEHPPGSVRKNTPRKFVGYCLKHRKIKSDSARHRAQRVQGNPSERPKSSPPPKSPLPTPMSLADPSVLAALHDVCLGAQRYDLACAVGSALAALVRGGTP